MQISLGFCGIPDACFWAIQRAFRLQVLELAPPFHFCFALLSALLTCFAIGPRSNPDRFLHFAGSSQQPHPHPLATVSPLRVTLGFFLSKFYAFLDNCFLLMAFSVVENHPHNQTCHSHLPAQTPSDGAGSY